jgi:eukaryotic-like serine/threonine-protein kinase
MVSLSIGRDFHMIGKALGHYQIKSQLGKGGMGEVYQAKDENLGRDVAIKILPAEFSKDAGRVARFQREAKVLASLNHSNIAAIYGFEESNGIYFLVLELIEGQTLADRIKGGPIPVEEALKLALQIAEAIEAAHEKGVIHRDLKPANIKVTPDGKVKVLDFGLAKAFAGEQVEPNLSNSPTLSNLATMQGVILGTAAYMSPEQARGKSADKRADIWSFGCVLFEMLSGQPAFQGEDITEILASVVKGGANFDLLPAEIYSRVREILTRCLQKELKKRYQDIGDVRLDLEHIQSPGGATDQTTGIHALRRSARSLLPWLASAVVLTAIIAGVAVWELKPPKPGPVIRFDFVPPKDELQNLSAYPVLAVSPDGRSYVYGTEKELLLRSMDGLNSRRIVSANGAPLIPFFSPDGKKIGYWDSSDNKLKKVTVNGGSPVVLCDAGIVMGANWGEDNTKIFAEEGKGILRIPASGGRPEVLIPEKKEIFYHPRILPGGKAVIFTIGPSPYKIAVQSLVSNERKVLFEGDCASYLSSGHIVYALSNNLYAVPFDPKKLELTGETAVVVEGVFRSSALYAPQFAVSNTGTLVYTTGAFSVVANSCLTWVDRQGKEEQIPAQANLYGSPRISPDGRLVALSIMKGGKNSLWVWDVARASSTQLTLEGYTDTSPVWSPDGKRIYFSSLRGGNYSVYWIAADGTGQPEPQSPRRNRTSHWPRCFSADGRSIVLLIGTGTYDIGALAVAGDQDWKSLVGGRASEILPRLSPDGRWLAYASNESGEFEIYVRPFPDVDAHRWKISRNGGDSPLWSPDGRELFYRAGDSVMAVSVKANPDFSPESPRTLFRGEYVSLNFAELGNAFETWDIAPDGKRFLMMKESASASENPRRINVVLNWTEELKRQVPVK